MYKQHEHTVYILFNIEENIMKWVPMFIWFVSIMQHDDAV